MICTKLTACSENRGTYQGHIVIEFVRICVCMQVRVFACSSFKICLYMVKVVHR